MTLGTCFCGPAFPTFMSLIPVIIFDWKCGHYPQYPVHYPSYQCIPVIGEVNDPPAFYQPFGKNSPSLTFL